MTSTKLERYELLVIDRKRCLDCAADGLLNPGAVRELQPYDSDQLGPWSLWNNDLAAKLLVVGQDWGGACSFERQQGRDDPESGANSNLAYLLRSVGLSPGGPGQSNRNAGSSGLFFTNAALCIKAGADSNPVKARCFGRCSRFLKGLIDIVEPKVIVTLGAVAYRAVRRVYTVTDSSKPARLMRDAVQIRGHRLENGSFLVPVWHCGRTATASRSLQLQEADWKRVKAALS